MMVLTKRGKRANVCRNNKQANGYMRMSRDNNRKSHYGDPLLMLFVYGNFDVLHKKFMYTETKTKHCPFDSSYTKKVKVLGKAGKRRLKQLRRIQENREILR